MHIQNILRVLVLFTGSILMSCESSITDSNNDFCDDVQSANFSDIEIKIEELLDYFSLNHVFTDKYYKMEILKLKNWLERRSCVQQVTVRPGIIETYPPIKELYIKFNTYDSTFIKTLDIILDPNLNVRFHQ